jgi:hypothetical protein
MRVLVVVGFILPLALAAQAGLARHSPEAAVKAAYAADELAIQGRGAGIMGDNALRARFLSRSLLHAMAANEILADSPDAALGVVGDPLSDEAPHMAALTVTPISESRDAAKVLAEFARGDGARERLTYALVFERGEWRIDDIDYAMLDGEEHTLRDTLATD